MSKTNIAHTDSGLQLCFLRKNTQTDQWWSVGIFTRIKGWCIFIHFFYAHYVRYSQIEAIMMNS